MMSRNLPLFVLLMALVTGTAQAYPGWLLAVANEGSAATHPIGLVMRPVAGAQTNAPLLPTPELVGVPPSAEVEFADFEPQLAIQWRDREGKVVRDPFRYCLILLSHDRGLSSMGRGNKVFIEVDQRGPLQTVWMTVVLQADQDPMLAWSATFRATWREVRIKNERARALFGPNQSPVWIPNPAPPNNSATNASNAAEANTNNVGIQNSPNVGVSNNAAAAANEH